MATFDENGNYVKTTWKGGDKITAAKLNKIEESLEAINNNDISRHVEADTRLDKLESGTASDKQELNAKVDALEDVVEANKDAADLEIYSINQHMTLLDKKIDDGVAEVEAIANTVDGKIAAAETNMQNQVNKGKADMEAMVAEVEGELDGINSQLEYNTNEISRKVNKNTKSMNFIAISDIHAGYDTTAYPASKNQSPARMMEMVKFINEFIDNNTVDFVLVLGDITSDNSGDTNWNYLKDTTKYFAKIKRPVYVLPGNHDAYQNEDFRDIYGYNRQYTLEYDDTIFIMLDTFNDFENVTGSGAPYTGVDMMYLNAQMEKFKDKSIILCSHYFNPSLEVELRDLISNNDNVLALFHGHTHTAKMEDFGGKPLINTGNFAYPSNYTQDGINSEDTLWGFAYVYTNNTGLNYKHCIPPFKYTEEFDYSEWVYLFNSCVNYDFIYYDDTKNADVILKSNHSHNAFNYDENIHDGLYTLNDYKFIEPNTDLNILGIGCYVSAGQSVTGTLTNMPKGVTGGFKLIVEKTRHAKDDFACLTQTVKFYGDTFVRECLEAGAYTDWVRVATSRNKTLYQGDLIGVGDIITIDLLGYSEFRIYINGGATPLSVVDYMGFVRGGGTTATSDNAQNYYFAARYVDGRLTIEACVQIVTNLNTLTLTKSNYQISRIDGIR